MKCGCLGLFLLVFAFGLSFGTDSKCLSLIRQFISFALFLRPQLLSLFPIPGADLVTSEDNPLVVFLSQIFEHVSSRCYST